VDKKLLAHKNNHYQLKPIEAMYGLVYQRKLCILSLYCTIKFCFPSLLILPPLH